MTSVSLAAPTSKKSQLLGRILIGLIASFMFLDAVMKFVKPEPVVEATAKLGFPEEAITWLGGVLFASSLLYIIPRTSLFGAILLTGYLGGAVASNLRINRGVFELAFPIVFGVLVWTGLLLADERLRAVVRGRD